MTEVYRFSESEILFFFLVLVRMTAFVVSWPVFGVETVSQQVKILFALILTLVIFPTLHISPEQAAVIKGDLVLPVIKEVFVGLSMGYLARFFFFTFRVAGEMISQAMGLSSAQVFNPTLGGQSTAVEQLYVTLASLFYLGINGHHYLVSGIVSSYQWVPAAQLTLNTSQFAGVGQMVQEVVSLGLQFSAPVVISILVVNLILGVVGKTVPQLNVLVTSFPINIMIGFALLMITLPMLMDQMGDYLQLSTTRVFDFVKAF
ncbi:MAG: flagellar biosynthetic protein FliR [Bdellovibrionales bacterium]|nr:flagellar biosynthetic protein FliR [Bdellovibrionales bacterium]